MLRRDVEFFDNVNNVEFFDNVNICVAVRITTHGSRVTNTTRVASSTFVGQRTRGTSAQCRFRDDEPLPRHPDGSLVTHRHVADQLKHQAVLLGYDPA